MTIPSWCRKGAKVVCIKRDAWKPVNGAPKPCGETDPTYGQALTIREVEVSGAYVILRFAEIVNPPLRFAGGHRRECGYLVGNFRPVVSQKDDLATHFEQYLKTDHRATERERA
jgi:hypothetical protein